MKELRTKYLFINNKLINNLPFTLEKGSITTFSSKRADKLKYSRTRYDSEPDEDYRSPSGEQPNKCEDYKNVYVKDCVFDPLQNSPKSQNHQSITYAAEVMSSKSENKYLHKESKGINLTQQTSESSSIKWSSVASNQENFVTKIPDCLKDSQSPYKNSEWIQADRKKKNRRNRNKKVKANNQKKVNKNPQKTRNRSKSKSPPKSIWNQDQVQSIMQTSESKENKPEKKEPKEKAKNNTKKNEEKDIKKNKAKTDEYPIEKCKFLF